MYLLSISLRYPTRRRALRNQTKGRGLSRSGGESKSHKALNPD
jgi:hypothetical protein